MKTRAEPKTVKQTSEEKSEKFDKDDDARLDVLLARYTGDPSQAKELKDEYDKLLRLSQKNPTDPSYRTAREKMRSTLCGSHDALRRLAAGSPRFAGEALSCLDPEALNKTLGTTTLKAVLGNAHTEVVVETLTRAAQKAPSTAGSTNGPDREREFDPKLFSDFAAQVGMDVWNDSDKSLARQSRGLGTRVTGCLWRSGNYDELCELIKKRVDTTLPFQMTEGTADAEGIWSGFCQPLEHIMGNYVKQVGETKPGQGILKGPSAEKLDGARKVLTALESRKDPPPSVLTKWEDVKGSELLAEFSKKPGTIWGFEDVRMPYVQAAHEVADQTTEGDQPLRMMELWTAVLAGAGDQTVYEQLLADPEKAAREFAQKAKAELEAALAEHNAGKVLKNPKTKFIAEVKNPDKYLENFVRDAESFLKDFATQLPKVEFDTAEIAGIAKDKLGAGLACRAGLWWAKENKKPLYYCLDGVNLDDVANYKTIKNKAIGEYLASQKSPPQAASATNPGAAQPATPEKHREVITLVELRDIIKNWADLGDTVKFVVKGKILSPEEALKKVDDVKKKLDELKATPENKTPAPPKEKYKPQLDVIDPDLFNKIASDTDAREVVRKAGYVTRMANTRWQIVVKYIASKCGVLFTYGLIPGELVPAAQAYRDSIAAPSQDRAAIERAKEVLVNVFAKWMPAKDNLKRPLRTALLEKPSQSAAASNAV